MRHTTITTLKILALIATTCCIVQAQWEQTNGPYGCPVISLVAFPDGAGGEIVLAGTYHFGVYRSTDEGANWLPANAGMSAKQVRAFACIANETGGTTVFAATEYGVYRSLDNAAIWTMVDSLDFPVVQATALTAIGPHVYVGTSQGSVFVSSDLGVTWVEADSGLPRMNWARLVTLLAASSGTGDTLLFASVESYPEGGIYRSTDGGASWIRTSNGISAPYVNAFTVSSDLGGNTIVFAGTYFDPAGVYRSDDNGASWVHLGGESVAAVVALEASGTSIFAGVFAPAGYGGVLRSTDNGMTWSKQNTGLLNSYVNCFAVTAYGSGGVKVFAATQGGVFRSSDEGKHWSRVNEGLGKAGVGSLAVSDDGESIVCSTGELGLFRSADKGASWTGVGDSVNNLDYGAVSSSGSTFYAGTWEGTVFRSTNQGISWDSLSAVNESVLILYALDSLVYAAGNGSLFKSTNGGLTWTGIDYRHPYFASLGISSLSVNGGDLYLGTELGVGHSSNGGMGWEWIFDGLSSWRVQALAFARSSVYCGTDQGIHRFIESRSLWEAFNLGVTDLNISSFAVAPDGSGDTVLFAGTDNGKIFELGSGRIRWSDVSTGLPAVEVIHLATDGTHLFALLSPHTFEALSLGGVWKRPLSEFVVDVEGFRNETPTEFRLEQNYPNPFNPSTVIRYALPQRSHVTLTVYNTLGQQVARLVDREAEAGSHEVRFEAGNLASGIYLYHLHAGAFVQTRRFVLLR